MGSWLLESHARQYKDKSPSEVEHWKAGSALFVPAPRRRAWAAHTNMLAHGEAERKLRQVLYNALVLLKLRAKWGL